MRLSAAIGFCLMLAATFVCAYIAYLDGAARDAPLLIKLIPLIVFTIGLAVILFGSQIARSLEAGS